MNSQPTSPPDFRRNSLNLIRLLAALQVFYNHAYAHLDLPPVPLLSFPAYAFPGVPIFFLLSGCLVWDSIDRTADFKTYLAKRVLRLYPELWLGVGVSLISILLLYDRAALPELGLFALTQGTFLQFWTPDSLRGFGCGTPNGSLWTICTMVQFYLAAWFLKQVSLPRRTLRFWVLTFCLSLAANVAYPLLEDILPGVVYKLLGQTLLPYFWLFWLGAFLREHFSRIMPWLKRFWWAGLPILGLLSAWGWDIPGAYGVLRGAAAGLTWIGFAYAFPRLQIRHDLSYGIYIYHMIVMNIFLELGWKGSWLTALACLGITLALASLSYCTVAGLSRRKKQALG